MPDFFDFSNPNGVSAPSLDEPGWGGDMIGGQQPIAPESYDIFGGMQSQPMPQQQRGNQVPFDALGAMAGIQMPEMPQQDSLGRYGLTDDQRQSASRQSLAEILMGAGQSMFADDPSAVVAAAGRSGGIQRAALDQYSTANANAYKMQMDAQAKKIEMIANMSDIQRQSYVIEAEKMRLEELRDKKAVAAEFGRVMAPVAEDFLRRTSLLYPDQVPQMRAQFLVAKEALASGDLVAADDAFNKATKKYPPEWKREMEEQMLRKTAEAAANQEMIFELASDPNYVARVKAVGGSMEAGPDGRPVFVSAYELSQRQLETAKLNAQIASEREQADYYRRGGNSGGGAAKVLTPKQVADFRVKITEAAQNYGGPVPDLKDAAAQEKYRNEQQQYNSVLESFGVDAKEWLTLNDDQRDALINGNGSASAPSGQNGRVGFAAPAAQGGGQRIPSVARNELVNAANKGPLEQRMAVINLVKSGDQEAKALVEQKMKEMGGREAKNDAEAAEMNQELYRYVVTHLSNL